ncbi:MAG TPA: T9SS type A sorting domain-containing protein [Saprospiraceae bacterium]|mgnify:CR=1 FL=1|nr:T9SS type A sorting domain-containing protein [Saprospiraceae bacterium]
MRTLQCLLILILSTQIIAQNFSGKKILIDDLQPIVSTSGGITMEDMVYCSSLENGKVNFISHINGNLEFYVYDNFQLSKITGQLPLSTFIVDFVDQNSDGKVDIQGNYDLLQNNGNYNFTNSGYPISGNWNIRAKRILDFNNDGNYDIISSSISFSSGAVNINFLDSNRNLVDKTTFTETGLIEAVRVLDINKDGLLDLVYTTKKFNDDKLIIQTNLGNNNFSKKEIKVSSTGEQLEIGDINNDGFDDIFITGFSGTDIVIFKNANGTFNNKETLVQTESIYTIKLNDLDKDGNLDIVYIERINFDSLNIVVATGTGTNIPGGVKTIGRVAFKGGNTGQSLQIYENWLSLFDYDQDGDTDILVNAILEKKFVVFDNLIISSASKDIEKQMHIHLYPNPTADKIYIHSDEIFDRVEIYNKHGEVIYNSQLLRNHEIDVHTFTAGEFIIKFYDNKDGFVIKKFIKI